MTDTAAPVAPDTPTPANEVPINPDPPSSPNPISNTPPEVPLSRKDAIKAAFDKATRQQDGVEPKVKVHREPVSAPKAKPAEAKPGHNKPPEETPKLDLKKRPEDQPRGDRGQFAPRVKDEGGPVNNEIGGPVSEQSESGKEQVRNELPENAPFREAPPRMAEHARREWAAAPESVRGEVHRMHNEFSQAYNQMKGAHDAFQPIARFHQMAQEHGTTLDRALENYTSMERKLRSDVVGGLDVIVNNLGLKSSDGQPINLRDIAYHVLSQSPDQLRQVQMGNTQQAANQQIGALHQKIDTLENALQQMHTQQQFAYTRAQIDQFADSHPRFDEIGTLVKQELELGFDLETAYRRAELLSPATRAAQTGTPAAQTRAPADRSISGSPGGVNGSNPSPRRSEKPVGRREAISNAIKRVNGGV